MPYCIPATSEELNCVGVRGTACSVATGWALLSNVGSTTALVVVIVMQKNVGSACVVNDATEKEYVYKTALDGEVK